MKKVEIKLHDGKTSYVISAEEGKTLRNKKTGWVSESAYLDYTCFEGELYLPTLEDFEEIEDKFKK
jgi:hypothetical protein